MGTIEFILTDTDYQKILAASAKQQGKTIEEVTEEAKIYLKELWTEHNTFADSMMLELINFTLSRGYDKTIDVDPDEMKALGKLMRRHSVAFVMTHKTYIDMWALTLVLARHGLPLPFIFAGINLSFFGAGHLGRKAGAIFIRRSFKDNPSSQSSVIGFNS